MANVRLQVIVPEELGKQLEAEALSHNATLSWVIRNILMGYVRNKPIRIPSIPFTGRGDEIGEGFGEHGESEEA